MRWDNLRLDLVPTDSRLTTPLFEQGAVVRTFDTPEFRGMTFYEVKVRSIINKVPESSYVPFRYTINPYRGCSHACAYCISGDTPILMADGRTKPIADVRSGDRIYGTVRSGNYRRYVTTDVLAHWTTRKQAYRITLEDGTKIVASGDHRFLSDRGWKHVTGSEWGRDRRPHLTLNNKLMGTGQFAPPPEQDLDYKRGYLCGMIRGDGHVASYFYARAGRANGMAVHRFRLALIDLEALQRSARFLRDFQVSTQEFMFQEAVGGRKPIHAIRTSARAHIETIHEVIEWPAVPTSAWSKGFLAGIFDAEGSYSRGILRFSNTDLEILGKIASALDGLGFRSRLEVTGKSNGLCTIRLLGGMREAMRLFHTTDPAITRKRSIEGRAIKNSSQRVRSIEPLGVRMSMYDITTGTGDFIANGVVNHNCFARKSHTYLDLDYGKDFDSRIVVKVNAPDLLRRELSHAKWEGEHIAMGTNVDTYQRAEGRYKLMHGILEALRDFANPFSILTKGTLILRDLDLLVECANVTDVATNVSVGSVDQELWKAVEPGTPNPLRRLGACRALNGAGVSCGVLMAPVLPFISDTDEALEETVRAIAAAGATHIAPIVLHLRRGGSREWYLRWLNERHPHLVPRYRELYGDRVYAPKSYQNEIAEKVARHARKFSLGRTTGRRARRIERETPAPEQLPLV